MIAATLAIAAQTQAQAQDAGPAAAAPPPDVSPPDLSLPDELATPDWLSDTVTRPHANVATSVEVPDIAVMPLGAVLLDGVGLLPTAITGLPPDLWGRSETATLTRLIRAQPLNGLPAMQAFTETLALAELDPPLDADPDAGALFLARLDLLLARGALDPAQALIDRAGPTNPEVFRRWFDVSLLTDHVARVCAVMEASPDIAPTFKARIFCLARTGDWGAAALSLGTGAALGRITEDEAEVIARFLDPELFEGADPLPPDPGITPLTFQMRVALGERPDTRALPLAFAHADLSNIAGWRAQIDAAERLLRAGAIAPTQWLDIVTDRVPSASGAVWDRLRALQAFDAAVLAGDTPEVARRIGPAWDAMAEVGLETAFAALYADLLLRLPLSGEAAALARRAGLLSPDYERVARRSSPDSDMERLAVAIACGQPANPPSGADARTRAVAAAFVTPLPPHRYDWFLQNDRLGEALLRAAMVLSAPQADQDDLTDALVLFRAVGLEDVARRAALQLLLTG